MGHKQQQQQIDHASWVTVMMPADYYEVMMDEMDSVYRFAQITGDKPRAARIDRFRAVAKAMVTGVRMRSSLPPRTRTGAHRRRATV